MFIYQASDTRQSGEGDTRRAHLAFSAYLLHVLITHPIQDFARSDTSQGPPSSPENARSDLRFVERSRREEELGSPTRRRVRASDDERHARAPDHVLGNPIRRRLFSPSNRRLSPLARHPSSSPPPQRSTGRLACRSGEDDEEQVRGIYHPTPASSHDIRC
jgi:hypothetical protein